MIFNSIDALSIKRAALCVNGAASPSGADAQAGKQFVTSFGADSYDRAAHWPVWQERLQPQMLI